jgi:hypothetical protein
MYSRYHPYRVLAFALAIAFGTILSCATPALAQNTGTIKGVWLQIGDTRTSSELNVFSIISSLGECALLSHFLATIEDEVIQHFGNSFAGKCELSADRRSLSLKADSGELMRCRISVTRDRFALSGCTVNGKAYSLTGDFKKVSNY